MIYFLRAGSDGPVKIGFTKDQDTLKRRVRTLQTGQPFRLSVLRKLDGPQWVEAWLHGFFSGARAAGEWFEYQGEMLTIEPPQENGEGWGPTEQVTVRLPVEMIQALKEAAKAGDRSLAKEMERRIRPTLVIEQGKAAGPRVP